MATKAEIIAAIKEKYDPDAGQNGKDLVLTVCRHRKQSLDMTKWKSLLNDTLEEILDLCNKMADSDTRNAARIAHGLQWSKR